MESNQKDIERLIELSQNEKRVKQKLVYDSVLLFLEGYIKKWSFQNPACKTGNGKWPHQKISQKRNR